MATWHGEFVCCMGDKPNAMMVLSSGGDWIRYRTREDADAGLLDWLTASCAVDPSVNGSVWHVDELWNHDFGKGA